MKKFLFIFILNGSFSLTCLGNEDIVDVHFHLREQKANEILEHVEVKGLSHLVVLSRGFRQGFKIRHPDPKRNFSELIEEFKEKTVEDNDNLAGIVNQSPKLIGFCSFSLLLPIDWVVGELERCHSIGLQGLKLHHENDGLDLTDAEQRGRFSVILQKASEIGFPVLVHAFPVNLKARHAFIQETVISAKRLGVKVIFAHAFGDQYENLMDLSRFGSFVPNIYIELSSILLKYKDAPKSLRRKVVWHLKKAGPDNILFGSDGPEMSTEETLDALRNRFSTQSLGKKYGFSHEEIKKILSSNAKKLFGLGRVVI